MFTLGRTDRAAWPLLICYAATQVRTTHVRSGRLRADDLHTSEAVTLEGRRLQNLLVPVKALVV